jgi:galactose mutarotase-like enzyme
MQHSISNSHLQVSVLSKGTEISSIKSKETGIEYMWNADSNIWNSHAPVLFPIIGSLKNNECNINKKTYKIPKHGFIRNNEAIILINRTDEELNFQLDYSEQSLRMFPYKFRFNISFQLQGHKLIVSHRVENLDSKEIFFSLGAHPGFKCPLNEGESYSDYYLEFEKEENAVTSLLSSHGLITDQTNQVLSDTNKLPLSPELFNNAAMKFKGLKSRQVS